MITSGPELLAVLAGHEPVDERERRSLHRFRTVLANLADPFNEHAATTHVTSAGIVIDQHGRLLLHRHKTLGIWLQPGGHVESGESLEEAVAREVREEAGLTTRLRDDRPLHVDVHPGPRGHLHLDVRWLLRADGDQALAPGSGESPIVRWFDLADAAAIVDEGLAGVVALLRSRQHHQTAT